MKEKLIRITVTLLLYAVFATTGASLAAVLLDDFSDPYINSRKWMDREFVREVVGGQLIVKLGNNDGWGEFRNVASLRVADSIDAMKCTFTLNALVLETGNNPRSFIRLAGNFYNTQPSGGATGDIWANILIGDRGSGLEVFWYVLEFTDDAHTSGSIMGGGTLIGPMIPYPTLPVSYTVEIGYDGNNQFTFTVGSVSQSFTGPSRSRPAQVVFKGIQAGIDCDNGTEIGYVSAAVDDLFINGNTAPYETFNGPTLDQSKWYQLEFVREIAGGEARLNVQAVGERTDASLRPGNQATDYLEATVTVESGSIVSTGATAIARIAGDYYNDSRGPGSGMPYNGSERDVWVDNRIVLNDTGNLSAVCFIWRVDTPDPWGTGTELFSQTYSTPINFDTAYTLSIEYTGSQIIFALNGESYTYDILTPTYLPSPGRSRQLRSRVYADPGDPVETGYMKVRFDDVYTSSDDYMIYATFDPPNVNDVIAVGGYVEDYGIPTTWGDEIQYVYFLSGTVGYKVRTWLTDSTDPADPTSYIEPRQHLDHPRFPGPIEPRHFEIVSSVDLAEEAPQIGSSPAHKKEFHVDSTGVYVGAWMSGIHKFDHDWNYIGRIAESSPEETESLAYDPVANTWYAGGRRRTIFQLEDSDGDNDFMDETWQAIFSYPSYAGGHHDGLEYAAGFLWVSDMTSDMIGQWQIDPDSGLWTEFEIYTYTNPAHVEGMGFGPNNHFWIGSGWGPDAYFYELGNDITTRYPVAVAGEDVPNHPPLIEIEFDASGSYHQNPDRSIVLYEWDFDGDGTYDYSGIDPIASHAYPAIYLPDGVNIDWDATADDYGAVLRVTDDTPPTDGGPLTHTDARIIHIAAPPWKPIADPDGPYNTRINQIVELNGSASYDPESAMYEPDHPWYETIASYEWDLDNDGAFDDASGPVVGWQWVSEGTYFVCLRVTDSSPSGPGGTFGDLDTDAKCTVVLVSAIHDVAVEDLALSTNNAIIGDVITIDVNAFNYGDYTETFTVQVTYDNQSIDETNVNDLDSGQTQALQFFWDTAGLSVGTYTIKVCAETVPGEIIVDNNCVEGAISLGEALPVYLDVKPGSCPNPLNVKGKGVLPVAVLGTEDFDVTQIDPSSVTLGVDNSDHLVSPLRWSLEDVATPFEGDFCDCHDLNGDGYIDLAFKFKTQELVNKLNLSDYTGETIPLRLTGDLMEEYGSKPIRGRDCMLVIDN
jgi:hypothetical protein